MKKISLIFTVLVAALMCIISLTQFNRDYSDQIDYPYYQTALDSNLGMTSVHLGSYLSEDNIVDTTRKIREFYENQDFTGFVFIQDDDLEKEALIKRIYVFDPGTEAFNHMSIISNQDWSLDNNEAYISNDPYDEDAIASIEYLDESYLDFDRETKKIVEIYNLNALELLESKPMYYGMVVFSPQASLDGMVDLMNTYFPDYFDWNKPQFSTTDDVSDIMKYGVDEGLLEIIKMPKPILYISSTTLILVSTILFFNKEKEILIRNLHGNKNSTIFMKILGKFILSNLLGFVLGFLLTLLFQADSASVLIFKYFKYTIPYLLIYLTIFMFSILILFAYLFLNKNISSLKRRKSLHQFDISIMLKIIIIIMLTMPLIRGLNAAMTQVKYLSAYSPALEIKNVDILRSLYSEDDLGGLQNESGMRTADKYEITFLDASKFNTFIKLINEHEGDTSSLEFRGDALSRGGNIPYQWPTLETNRHIGKFVDLKDTNGNILTPEVISKSSLNFLVPESIAQEFLDSGHVTYTDTNTIIIKDPGRVYTTYTSDEYPAYLDNPILAVYGNDTNLANMTSNLFYSNKTAEDRIHFASFLEDLDSQGMSYYLSDGQSVYQYNKQIMLNNLLETSMLILISLLIIGLFAYVSASIYFDQYKKKIIVQYIHGKSYLERYGPLYLMSTISILFAYAILLLFARFRLYFGFLAFSSITFLILIILLIDLLLMYHLISKFEKRNISQLLKGDFE